MFRNFTLALLDLGVARFILHNNQPTKKLYAQPQQRQCAAKEINSDIKSEKLIDSNQKYQRCYLGEKYPNIYFTYREATCMLYMMQGLTYKQIAQVISLSPRTIGFYCMNMRGKLRCKTKGELVKLIKKTAFMSFISENTQD